MKAKPYVYKGEHKVSKKFYIGYRERNTDCGIVDLIKYRTSSKKVNPVFDEFEWIIVAEFDNGNDAYDYEQKLIYEQWNNPLLLNKNCHYGQKRFKSTKGRVLSNQTKQKISNAHTGKKRKQFTKDTLKKMSLAQAGRSLSDETKDKIRKARLGTKQSSDTIAKRVAKNTGKKRSIDTCKKIGDIHRGKIVSNETKTLQSQKAKERAAIKYKCPYCQKEVSASNFVRWHGNNCKHKKENV